MLHIYILYLNNALTTCHYVYIFIKSLQDKYHAIYGLLQRDKCGYDIDMSVNYAHRYVITCVIHACYCFINVKYKKLKQ